MTFKIRFLSDILKKSANFVCKSDFFIFQKATTLAPIFLFVVDTCLPAEELKALKDALQKAIAYLPADALIGLITFGRVVEIHELNVKGIARSYVFKVGYTFIFINFFGSKKVFKNLSKM